MTTLLAPMEYRSISSYDCADIARYERECDEGGWQLYQLNGSRTTSFTSMAHKRQCQRCELGLTVNLDFRADEVAVLKWLKHFKDTGEDPSIVAYPGILHIFMNRGWLTERVNGEHTSFFISDEGIATLEHHEEKSRQTSNENGATAPHAKAAEG